MLKVNKNLRISRELGKILLKKIFLKDTECIKNLKQIKRITTKNYLRIA